MKTENMKNPAELSDQELSKISGGTADNFDLENGELSEEALEQVSGGSALVAVGAVIAAAFGIADIIIMRL